MPSCEAEQAAQCPKKNASACRRGCPSQAHRHTYLNLHGNEEDGKARYVLRFAAFCLGCGPPVGRCGMGQGRVGISFSGLAGEGRKFCSNHSGQESKNMERISARPCRTLVRAQLAGLRPHSANSGPSEICLGASVQSQRVRECEGGGGVGAGTKSFSNRAAYSPTRLHHLYENRE